MNFLMTQSVARKSSNGSWRELAASFAESVRGIRKTADKSPSRAYLAFAPLSDHLDYGWKTHYQRSGNLGKTKRERKIYLS